MKIKRKTGRGFKKFKRWWKKKIVNIHDDYEDKLLHSREQQIFEHIYSKRLDKIEKLTKKVDDNNLIFTIISTRKTIDFSKKDDSLTSLNKIKKGEITIEEAKESPKDFDKYLKIIRTGNKNHEREKTLANLNILFNSGNQAINFIDGYGSMILEARQKAAEEQSRTGLKMLTSKQMIQRLPIPLVQVKAGNNSESLLNEIRQIIYSLYQSKQINKKVYNNIIKSIQI